MDDCRNAFAADAPETSQWSHVHWLVQEFGDKWSLPILCRLGSGPLRFLQLKRALGTISQRMLTRTLKKMEQNGVVLRTSVSSSRLQVSYELTPFGETVYQSVLRLNTWMAEVGDLPKRDGDTAV